MLSSSLVPDLTSQVLDDLTAPFYYELCVAFWVQPNSFSGQVDAHSGVHAWSYLSVPLRSPMLSCEGCADMLCPGTDGESTSAHDLGLLWASCQAEDKGQAWHFAAHAAVLRSMIGNCHTDETQSCSVLSSSGAFCPCTTSPVFVVPNYTMLLGIRMHD